MSMRKDKIDSLFERKSFVVEAALLCIASMIEQVKDIHDVTIFFELAAARLAAEIGALTDGSTIAIFVSKKLVTLRKLTKRTWNAWNVHSRPKSRFGGGSLVCAATMQMRGVVEAMRDALAEYTDEEFGWIEKVDSAFEEMVGAAKRKDSDLVSAVRHKVAYLSLLIEKLFGYDPVSALVSEAGDGDWTDVLIERLRNEPNYIKHHVLYDDCHVADGIAQWNDVAKNPETFVLGKFRIRYFEQNSSRYFKLINKIGESCHFLLNFILFHTGFSLVFDDLSVQRVNKNFRDVVFAIRKSEMEGNQGPYTEDNYKDAFFARHVLHEPFAEDITLSSEAKAMEADIYTFDDEIAKMRGSKEICYALEWLCLSDVTNPGPYVQLATAYINAKWPEVANMLIDRAYNNSFVKCGVRKCCLYEHYFPQFFKGVSRPQYLNDGNFLDSLASSLQDTRKERVRMLRVPDAVWSR